jgi:serine/threonine-protein kinase/endoribonuclease IRE1
MICTCRTSCHPCRVENEDREPDPSLLNALESYTAAALGPNWGAALDPELISNLGKYRRYDYTCLRDLLRVVRNKRNHFREMPGELQRLLGPLPDGFYRCGRLQWGIGAP